MSAKGNDEPDRPGFWDLVADKIRREPGTLDIARGNIVRWREQGHSATHRLDEWERLIAAAQGQEGRSRLLEVMRSPLEPWRRLREFHPFAGVLSREERRRARELCGYRH